MIKYAPIDLDKISNLIADIQKNVKKLTGLTDLSLNNFKKDSDNFGLTEHYFRRSLEAVLTIGTHILSRLPAKTKDYQDIIVSLGNFDVIPKKFAEKNKKLASYRNRLVHLYWEVSEDELYKTVKQHLNDLDQFCKYFQKVAQNPKKYGLSAE